jgi:peptidyl-prolyl cis-trans isomerase A (cyclophilin A)
MRRALATVCVVVLALAGSGAMAGKEALLDPAKLTAKAPETFEAKFETSQGDFTIEVTRAWSPLGADRFYNLVNNGYYDNIRFFRVVPGFVVQFGIHGEPSLSAKWKDQKIQDEPVKESNKAGYVTYAKGGPNSRTTQVFINLKDNANLDSMGFAPFGKITNGMDVVQKLNGEYGDSLTSQQGQIYAQGNVFLAQKAPKLDYIKKATVVPAKPAAK